MTVPTTTITTTTTPALPLAALGRCCNPASRRAYGSGEALKENDALRDHHNTTCRSNCQYIRRQQRQSGGWARQVSCSDTVDFRSCGQKKRRGRPKKNPQKKTIAKSAKSDATAETPQQAPEETPEDTPQVVVNKTTPQKEGQEENKDPVIPEPSSPPPPADMVVAKVGQYSAADLVKNAN